MDFIRPEYILRPSQILRRIAYGMGMTRANCSAMTPWGLPVSFDPNELHGRAMLTLGLSDLRTNEIISRLVEPGDTAIDIGANIGIMTSLMAARAGPTGAVYAFEPHPETRKHLESNVRSWTTCNRLTAPVSVLPYAISRSSGEAALYEPGQFSANSGLASLENSSGQGGAGTAHIAVETVSFDEWADDIGQIKLVKIDVEGHEDSVLDGMEATLAAKRIDHLIFEEMRPLPSPATERLTDHGYACYMIDRSFWGPLLTPDRAGPSGLRSEATNVLATRQPEINRLLGRSWSCLR